MKKKLCALLALLLMFCLCSGALALAEGADEGLDHITDSMGILTTEQTQQLEQLAADYSEEGKVALYIVIMDDYTLYPGDSFGDCAEQLYDYFQLGYGEDRDGLLMLVSMKEQEYYLYYYGSYAGYCFGDHNRDLAEKAFKGGVIVGDMAGGFETYLKLCGDILATAAVNGLEAERPTCACAGQSLPDNSYWYGVSEDGSTPPELPKASDEAAAEPETAEPTAEPETAEAAAEPQQSEEPAFPYVLDNAGLLSDSQRENLENRAKDLSKAHACSLYVVTMEDFSELNPDVYEAAKKIYTAYNLGWDEGKDGVILLLSMKERDFALVGHGQKGETICGHESRWLIEDEFLDNFKKNDWNGGFSDYLSACDKQLTKLEKGEDITEGADIIVGSDGLEYHSYNAPRESKGLPTLVKLLICIGVPCLAAVIVCSSFKSQMKTANERTTAEEYVVPGSAVLRAQDDRFINRTESRVRISSDSDSSRGGGMSSGGGSSFHSGGGFSGSSGKF